MISSDTLSAVLQAVHKATTPRRVLGQAVGSREERLGRSGGLEWELRLHSTT